MAKKKPNTTGGGGWYFRRSNGSGITVTKLPGGFPEPTGPQQLQTAAKSALSMVKTIVQFLPVKGETATKSDINIIDRWFESAGEDYTTFERLRNPYRLSWPGPGGFDVASPSRKSLPYFAELCKAMSRVCEAYQWQGISDGSEIPNSMQRFGTALIPHIDAGLLHAVAVAGQGLLEDLDPADIDGRQLVEKLAGQDAHDNGNKDKQSLPESPDVLELCRHLKAKLGKFGTMTECARDFCRKNGCEVSKAENLLRQAKRFRHLWPT